MTKSNFHCLGSVLRTIPVRNGVEFQCAQGRMRVTALCDHIVRVRATQQQAFGPDFSYAVAKRRWPAVRANVSGGNITTERLRVTLRQSPLHIAFATADGVALNREVALEWEGARCRSRRTMMPGEQFFGCGERGGMMNHRGAKLTFWNTDDWNHTYLTNALYVSIPFLISTRAGAHYGIFWDNTHRTTFDFRNEKEYTLESDGGEVEYYFIAGDSVREIVRSYSELTGRMRMPPRWALGYHQCRWSYSSAKEILALARQFRRRKIPCSALYCDIDYMDGYRVFTWNPKTFPQPRSLIQKLHSQGIHLVTILDPGVKNDDNPVCREGKRRGMFVKKADGSLFTGNVWPGECVFPDFTDPRVRRWWGGWHQKLLQHGVDGFWNDMNEPAVWEKTTGGTMPLDNLHDYDGQRASHARAHNVYGMCMSRACQEGLLALRPDQRPFVISRAAYAGIQRYAMLWTGDNQSRWEQLAVSIPECLNLSLSGVPFCGPDVGGFGGDTTGELLARWTQVGAFFPFFRNHAAKGTRRQEPWRFGRRVEAICRRYITLRYHLMPYLYHLFHEATTDGTPILRPLFWEFPDDPHGYAVDDQFLLGPSLLVAPVLKPAATQRAVWLPEGASWYDYWTQQQYAGGQYITAVAPLETLPLYVRAGTILPVDDPVVLHVYPGEITTGSLYEDDGASFAYERGAYSLTRFSWKDGSLHTDRKSTGYKSAARTFRVVCLGQKA